MIGSSENSENDKCQSNDIHMPLDSKFDYGQWAPGVEYNAALIESFPPEQNNQRDAGNHVKNDKETF